MTTTNLGRVGFVLKGNWVSGTYKRLDVVRYSSASWGCQSATTTGTPGISSDWVKLTDDGGAGLGGNTFTGDQNLSGHRLIDALVTDCAYALDNDGNISGGTWAIDYANGPVIKATATAAITSITMSNWPASGTAGHLRLMLSAGAYSITFPAWKWIKSDLTTTTTFADLGLTLPSANPAIIDLFSDDGGTTMYATVGRN